MDLTSALRIGLAILVLASFFATYLSTRTWHVAQVILVALIFFASIFFWYLSAVTLKIHQLHRDVVERLEPEIDRLAKANDALVQDTRNEEVLKDLEAQGLPMPHRRIAELRQELHKMLIDRGRVWSDVASEDVKEDGTARLTIEDPDPHKIEPGTVLFLFEQGAVEEGSRYLGEFKATEAGEQAVTVVPTIKLSERELKRLNDSQASWVLYEVMPVDRHDLFVSLNEDDLKEILPKSSYPEYKNDGKPAKPDDTPERVVGYKKDGTRAGENEADRVVEKRYVRQLRDYGMIFHRLHGQKYIDADRIEQVKRDVALLTDAVEKVRKDVAYRETEKQKVAQDLQKFKEERDVIARHLAALEKQLATLIDFINSTREENLQMASELTQRQLQAAREIENRTSRVPPRGSTPLELASP